MVMIEPSVSIVAIGVDEPGPFIETIVDNSPEHGDEGVIPEARDLNAGMKIGWGEVDSDRGQELWQT
jgi:hypothetical protein